MTTYTHQPTGITVERNNSGSLSVDAHGCHLKWRVTPDVAAAIHAAYFDSLGLWLDQQTGAVVMSGTTPPGEPGMAILHPGGKLAYGALDASWGGVSRDIRDRYLATVTPQPTPQPGEQWVLLEDLGSVEQPVEVVQIAGDLWFAWARDGRVYSERVADRHPSTYRRAES